MKKMGNLCIKNTIYDNAYMLLHIYLYNVANNNKER